MDGNYDCSDCGGDDCGEDDCGDSSGGVSVCIGEYGGEDMGVESEGMYGGEEDNDDEWGGEVKSVASEDEEGEDDDDNASGSGGGLRAIAALCIAHSSSKMLW